MSTTEAIESFTLGAIWSAALFTICGQFGHGALYAVGSSGAVCGIVGYTIYKGWKDPTRRIGLMFPFNQLIHIPNQIIHPIIGKRIPELFTYREFFYTFVIISSFLAWIQHKRGGGMFAHTGHLGGILGGWICGYNRSLQNKR